LRLIRSLIVDSENRSSESMLVWQELGGETMPIGNVRPVMLEYYACDAPGYRSKMTALTCSKVSEPYEANLLLNPHTPMNALPL
jgi:hypothetical protein